MLFVDGVQYWMDACFHPSYFLNLMPEDIARYFCLIAYGTAEPDLEHDFPSQARSSHLEFAKKAISWYMPNKLGHRGRLRLILLLEILPSLSKSMILSSW
jgi:hypothetical protein